ncbi:DoxX family protein [Geotalea sp. SG265]|uniref:DoxX family protein n=1 Tax=Geotalea sp. SG265 TaxID=2922867 RepID=UPI001FAF72FE|nr:DoxX family protein [Geotalea sp. SG265]
MGWFMSNYVPHCYAALRMVAGFLFLWHGMQKLFSIPSPMPPGAPPFIIYGAGPIELICGILVMIGFFTHWAAFIASGEMAFAYWIHHAKMSLLPLQNQGELAVLYCFVFLFIAAQGGGIWSIDSRRKGSSHGH